MKYRAWDLVRSHMAPYQRSLVVADSAAPNMFSKERAVLTSSLRAVTAIFSVSAASFACVRCPSGGPSPTSILRTPSPFFHGDRLATPAIPSVCTLHRWKLEPRASLRSFQACDVTRLTIGLATVRISGD